MEFVVFIECVLCLTINYRRDKKIKLYNILIVEFLVIISLYFINVRDLYTVSQKTFFLIFLGIAFYELGVRVFNHAAIYRKSPNSLSYDIGIIEEPSLNRKIIIAIYLFCIIVLAFSVQQTIKYLLQGYSLYLLRTDVLGLKSLPEWYDITYVYFVVPLTYILIAYGINRLFCGVKLEFILATVLALMSSFANGGRIILLFYIVQLVYWSNYYNSIRRERTDAFETIKKPKLFLIILLIVIIFSLVVVLSRMRGVTKSVALIFNDYLAPSLQYLDASINNFDKSGSYCLSFYSFRGLWDPLLMILKAAHIISSRPEIYYTATALNQAADASIVVGSSGFDMNAFTTVFYAFYVDFDIIGIMMGSFIYGAVTAKLQNRVYNKPNIYNVLVYSLLLNMVVTSFVRWQLVNPAYALSFVYCRILFGHHSHHINIGRRRII